MKSFCRKDVLFFITCGNLVYQIRKDICLFVDATVELSSPHPIFILSLSLAINVRIYYGRNSLVLTLRLLMSYIYGAPSKARNSNVVYIWTYVWQR